MKPKPMQRVFLATALFAAPMSAPADTYTLAIQPLLPAKQTESHYAPLARYLTDKTGHTIALMAAPNFLSYWQEMRKGRYDLVMDAAHLTDFRAQNMNYRVLAKVLDVVSFTLVTGEDTLVFEPGELVGKRVASLAAPSRGALTLDSFFDNPMRRPIMVEVTDTRDAIDRVLDNQAQGAIIPTPLVGANPQLNVVFTQEQWPHMGFSASPQVPEEVAVAVQAALIGAIYSDEGQAVLQQINFPGFEKADAQTYAGYSDILKGFWGSRGQSGGGDER